MELHINSYKTRVQVKIHQVPLWAFLPDKIGQSVNFLSVDVSGYPPRVDVQLIPVPIRIFLRKQWYTPHKKRYFSPKTIKHHDRLFFYFTKKKKKCQIFKHSEDTFCA